MLNFRKFTLIELFVTIAVLAVLVSLIFPSFKRFQSLAEQTNCKTNMKYMASAFTIYIDDHDGLFPYGLPSFTFTGHYNRSNYLSPQELVYDYLDGHTQVYTCPSDSSPENYQWWRYRNHPNGITASSYMFCENGLWGNSTPWRANKPLAQADILEPNTYPYMTDGAYCPNGWSWRTLDPNNYSPNSPWLYRIDWDHEQYINVLFGDMHVGDKWQFDGIATMRNRPDTLD